jgi:hypothetical protein
MQEDSPDQLQIMGAVAVVFATLGFLFFGFMGIMPLPSRRGLLIGHHVGWIALPIGMSLVGISLFIAGSVVSKQLRQRFVIISNVMFVLTFLVLGVLVPLMSVLLIVGLGVFAILYWVPRLCPNSRRGRIALSTALFLVIFILIFVLIWLLVRYSRMGNQVI